MLNQQSSCNIRNFLFYILISGHPKMWGELFLEKYKKCLGLGLESPISRTVKKTFFGENVRRFLFFELGKFPFSKYKNFFQRGFLLKFFYLRARKFHFLKHKGFFKKKYNFFREKFWWLRSESGLSRRKLYYYRKKVWMYSEKNYEVFETELFITCVSESPFFCHDVQITKRSKYEFSLFHILCIQKKIGDSSWKKKVIIFGSTDLMISLCAPVRFSRSINNNLFELKQTSCKQTNTTELI